VVSCHEPRPEAGEDFPGRQDYKAFIDLLKSTSEMFRLEVAACCLMSNHYHLLLQTSDANLGRAMRHLGGVYTQWFNRRHDLDGQLFRGRYKAILVGEDEYLLGLVRYIHHNPLKAGVVASLDDHPWSSHHGYLGRGTPWEWLATGHVLSQFSGEPARARAEYRRFMARDNDEHIERIFSLKKLPAILGSQKFVQSIKDRFFASKLSAEVPQSRTLAPVSMEAVVRAVCVFCEVNADSLAFSARGVTNEARDIAIYLARSYRGDSLNSIGAYLASRNIVLSAARSLGSGRGSKATQALDGWWRRSKRRLCPAQGKHDGELHSCRVD